MCPQETHCPPSGGLEEGYCTTERVYGWWYLDTKGNAVKRYHKFSPNIPPKCKGEIFLSSCSPYENLSDKHSLYKYIYPEGWDTWLPRCLEHSEMIRTSKLSVKRDKVELHIIWLDLANVYGSVPHHLIRMALDFSNFPSKVREIIRIFFNSAVMKFTVKDYTTKWQALEIGIMMDCVISPLLFVLAMELILRGAANTSKGVRINENLTLPPSRAFMDDITILVPSKIAADVLIQRYYDFSTWARMKAKPKKSRSLSLVGGSVREIDFKIGGDTTPTVREKPVKSLRRLYSIPLTDHHRGPEVQKIALMELKSIDKTCLPGKMKAWCYQHGLLPRLLCPLQIYDIVLSHVKQFQQYNKKYLRKWLGFLPCFSKVGLYTNYGNLQLPISSLVEEFKIGKVRHHMMMKDSADEIIRKAYPEIK